MIIIHSKTMVFLMKQGKRVLDRYETKYIKWTLNGHQNKKAHYLLNNRLFRVLDESTAISLINCKTSIKVKFRAFY